MPPLEIQKLKEQENALNPYSSDYTDAKIKLYLIYVITPAWNNAR